MPNQIWNLQDLIKHLKNEQDLPSRFPVRIIFVNSLAMYKKLVNELLSISDNNIPLAKFSSVPDVLPDIDALVKEIMITANKSNVVLSMGEYLRISMRLERTRYSNFRNLFNMQQPLSSKRLWLPMYCATHLFEELIRTIDIRHENHVFYLEPLDSNESFILNIYSEDFRDILKDNFVNGIQSWINIWDDDINDTQYHLITQHIDMIEASDGVYSVNIIKDTFDYIRVNVANSDQLEKTWGTNSYWTELSKYVQISKSVDQLLLNALNLIQYEHEKLLSSWGFLGDFEKWVMWVWNKIHISNNYVSYAISQTKSYKEIETSIECAVFNMPENNETEWLNQRTLALRCLHRDKLSISFWDEFDSINDIKLRLKILTDISVEERVHLIKSVSLLLNEDKTPGEVVGILNGKYPELCEYLLPSYRIEPPELEDYFEVYRVHKLKDEFNFIVEAALEEVSTFIWSFNSRGSVIEKYNGLPNTALLCIDGMSIEWLGLLLMKVKEKVGINPNTLAITTAKIPTTTENNWPMDIYGIEFEKVNWLDDINHDKTDSQTAEYPLIIQRQIAVFEPLAEKIGKMYHRYKTVIVTADHGSSRMAALSFHQSKGIEVPPGGISEDLGRYCILKDKKQLVSLSNTERDGDIIAFKNHQHFSTSGRVNGELHGGATPEELLVPVIIFENIAFVEPLKYFLKNDKVKRTAGNIVELEIIFNQSVSKVEVRVNKILGSVTKINDNSWLVALTELDFQTYELEVIADSVLMQDKKVFKVERHGLQVNDDI